MAKLSRDDLIEVENDRWYELGQIHGLRDAESALRTKAGKLYATGDDQRAQHYRNVAADIMEMASTKEKSYESKYQKKPYPPYPLRSTNVRKGQLMGKKEYRYRCNKCGKTFVRSFSKPYVLSTCEDGKERKCYQVKQSQKKK